VQKKPIELLKYVVDNGGQATEAEIADALWHQADGDLAHNSFKMALSRLRNLIGKESIKFQAGKVSINPDCCWVEALASRTEIS
jgi:DNA-binding SARP family transcriptional activator